MTGFAHRHIGTDASAQALMLNALGFDSLPAFMEAAVPGHLRMLQRVKLKPSRSSARLPMPTPSAARSSVRGITERTHPR